MTGVRSSLREQLHDVVGAALNLNDQLEEVVAVPTSKLGRGKQLKRGRIDHSQPPWNAPVAHLILELHTEAREMEAMLRIRLNMGSQTRGDSEANTVYALDAVLNLSESVNDPVVRHNLSWLNSWCSRALVALGERDMPQHLPRNVGHKEPQCPYCNHFTLRFWATQGEVRCINPECVDETKKRPAARMEYSPVSQEWVLAWRDGMVGVATPSLGVSYE